MSYLKHRCKSSCFLLCITLLFFLVCYTHGQDNKDALPPKTSAIESTALLPVAVPVLTPQEAHKANDEAIKAYNAKLKDIRNQKINQKIKKVIRTFLSFLFYIVVLLLIGYFRKPVRCYLIRFYKSPYGRLFYSRSFCLWDWLGIALIFGLTFFFSILAGQKAMSNGDIGRWYANDAAPIALSIYNTGKVRGLVAVPESKLDCFLKPETSLNKGTLSDHFLPSITNKEAIPQKYTEESGLFESTGITWLVAFWWKIIGYPDWSSLYILFSFFYSLIAVAAYCALRQITGTVPSLILGLLLSSYPSMMHQVLFGFRDGMRSLFSFIAIAILLYLLKGAFRWKGTIICSLFLLLICSFSTYFRQDFIVFIPFILVATFFFHGKLLFNYKKKIAIVLSVVAGLIISLTLPGIAKDRYGMGHVLYIGMSEHPYMDYLHFSADHYSKGIVYSDWYGFISAAGKAYRDRGAINIGTYTKEYDEECKKEIFSLFHVYPYDFFRFALSSTIQSLHIGSSHAERRLKWIDSAPGYGFFQKHSKDVYSDVSSRLYFYCFLLTVLLFLGGGFYKNILVMISFMLVGGIYSLQFDIRHYFYLLIVSLLMVGFVFDRYFRILFILLINWKRTWKICVSKKKPFLIHCAVFSVLVGLAFAVLFLANVIQSSQVKREVDSFNTAKTVAVEFKTNSVPSKMNKNIEATEVLLPGFFKRALDREDPKQIHFTDFLKVKFRIDNAKPQEKFNVYAIFENTADYTFPPVINFSRTCLIRLTFNASDGLNTLYLPVYYSRNASPLIGIELVADGKPFEVESVERIVETNRIRTQSAFLVPGHPDDMKVCGDMDWDKIFWGDR